MIVFGNFPLFLCFPSLPFFDIPTHLKNFSVSPCGQFRESHPPWQMGENENAHYFFMIFNTWWWCHPIYTNNRIEKQVASICIGKFQIDYIHCKKSNYQDDLSFHYIFLLLSVKTFLKVAFQLQFLSFAKYFLDGLILLKVYWNLCCYRQNGKYIARL